MWRSCFWPNDIAVHSAESPWPHCLGFFLLWVPGSSESVLVTDPLDPLSLPLLLPVSVSVSDPLLDPLLESVEEGGERGRLAPRCLGRSPPPSADGRGSTAEALDRGGVGDSSSVSLSKCVRSITTDPPPPRGGAFLEPDSLGAGVLRGTLPTTGTPIVATAPSCLG